MDVTGRMNKNEYEKSYLELYELIKRIPLRDRKRIPKDFINFLKENMSSDYVFKYDIIMSKRYKNGKYDENKTFLEQDIMVETKALLVQLYAKYLSKPEEKEFWDSYRTECLNLNADSQQ